jgi:nucleoside-diphosphate-sugar epimerase
MAMKSNVNHGFFNVGTATTISVNELADIIVREFGLSVKPIYGPALPGDVHTTKADISQAKKLLNWEPKIGIREWLKEIISTKINLDSIID